MISNKQQATSALKMRGKIDEPKNRGKTDRGNNYVTINYSDQRYKKPFQKLRNGY